MHGLSREGRVGLDLEQHIEIHAVYYIVSRQRRERGKQASMTTTGL
jgi:hypothetical protein